VIASGLRMMSKGEQAHDVAVDQGVRPVYGGPVGLGIDKPFVEVQKQLELSNTPGSVQQQEHHPEQEDDHSHPNPNPNPNPNQNQNQVRNDDVPHYLPTYITKEGLSSGNLVQVIQRWWEDIIEDSDSDRSDS
jgi:hypothetical protein